MRLATARLPISHNDAIKAIEDISDHGVSYLLVSLVLVGVFVEHTVVHEVPLVIVWTHQAQGLVVLTNRLTLTDCTYVIQLHTLSFAFVATPNKFIVKEGSQSDHHFESLILFFLRRGLVLSHWQIHLVVHV